MSANQTQPNEKDFHLNIKDLNIVSIRKLAIAIENGEAGSVKPEFYIQLVKCMSMNSTKFPTTLSPAEMEAKGRRIISQLAKLPCKGFSFNTPLFMSKRT